MSKVNVVYLKLYSFRSKSILERTLPRLSEISQKIGAHRQNLF